METVHVVLLDRRFNILWWSARPYDNPFVGKPLLQFAKNESILREKFATLMLNDPVEEFVTEFTVYEPPDLTRSRQATMQTKLIRIDDLATVAAVGIFKEVVDQPNLAEQDQEILRLLADDKTLVEIADQMGRSLSTIEYRAKRLKDSFGVKTLPGLTAEAIRRGSIKYRNGKRGPRAVRRPA
jgi:DNA-binding CsgD family transcriptional regulator